MSNFTDHLKKCPMCNGKAIIRVKGILFESSYVQCQKCGLRTAEYDSLDAARRAWNKQVHTKTKE